MSIVRKISALKLIQQIKQHEIDGHAGKLASIRAHQTTLRDEIETLIRLRDSEGHAATPEAAAYLAGFLRAVRARNSFLAAKLLELDREATEVEMQLLATFAEKKASDSVLCRAEEQVILESGHAEIAESEEIARNIFFRKRATHEKK